FSSRRLHTSSKRDWSSDVCSSDLTCGNPFTREEPFFSKFEELMQYTDLLLFDIQHIDTEQHKKLTRWRNENILEMARYLSSIGKIGRASYRETEASSVRDASAERE